MNTSAISVALWVSSCGTSLGILSRLLYQGKAGGLAVSNRGWRIVQVHGGKSQDGRWSICLFQSTPFWVGMEYEVTWFQKLFFCAGKLSDVLYVPPWR